MAFPTTLDSDFGTLVDSSTDYPEAAHINTLRRAIEGLEAKVGINSSAVVTSLDYKVNKFFVSDRAVYIYQDDADIPDGWSKVAVTDKVLAVKGGSNAYNVNGGNTGGTFSISVANMPAHTHVCNTYLSGSATNTGFLQGVNTSSKTVATGSAGGSDGKYRPTACVGIIIAMN